MAAARIAALLSATLFVVPGAHSQAGGPRTAVLNGDYIAAIVNQELVTAGELERRVEQTRANATRAGMRLPAEAELRRQVFDALIEERVMISVAREMGMRVDEAELDRTVQSIAAQNQLSVAQLRDRLRAEGTDFTRFRATLRDQIMVERLREREVYRRIQITDEEIERQIATQRAAAAEDAEVSVAQIFVTVPEGADAAMLAERRARVDAALARVRAGEPFEQVARDVSEDANRAQGGVLGPRPLSRLPDLFVEAIKGLKTGDLTPAPVRSSGGFHILKVLERKDEAAQSVTQTRARHILIRTSTEMTPEAAVRRMAGYREEIASGRRKFEEVARQVSEDASAATGGDLGWGSPGMMVPEFEQAMNALEIGGLSEPVVSRFGVHLIQVVERRTVALDPKQLREQARNVLREQKFEQAYLDWSKELRSRAYVEVREPPQ